MIPDHHELTKSHQKANSSPEGLQWAIFQGSLLTGKHQVGDVMQKKKKPKRNKERETYIHVSILQSERECERHD